MNNKYLYTAIALFVHSLVFAQTEGEVEGKTFIIQGKTKLELVPANRFYDLNSDVQPVPEVEPKQYDTRDYSINPPRFDTKVMIPKMPTDSLDPILPNYIKAGAGNYASALLDAYFTNKRSATLSYGAHIKHYSSQKGSLNNSGQSQNLLEVFGSRYGKVNAWNGHISYSHDRYNYYGLPQDIGFDKDSIKQVYQLIHADISTKKTLTGKNFGYSTGLDLYYLATKLKAKEMELLWNGAASYKFNTERAVLLDASVSSANRTDSSTISRMLLTVRPVYKITRDSWELKVGMTINYSSDTMKGSDGTHAYPYAHFDYNFLPGKVLFFAGINGGLEKNTYRTFIQTNPYIGSDPLLAHTNKKFGFYAGSSGNINDKVNYKGQLGFANYTNQYFFSNSATDSSRFSVFYDRGTVSLFSLDGSLFYDVSKQWRISVNAIYNAWKTDQLTQAWHRPAFQSSIGLQYNLKKKIYLEGALYYISGIKAKNFESNKEATLDPIADLNFKAEYRFSQSFSAFLEFNNILSQKYQRYQYYQVKGFNVLAGLTYSF